MPQLLVSVGLSCYNGERYLRDAIDSVLAQTYRNIELIVVDDGSTTEGVRNICEGYGGKLRYIRQKNMGLSAARNTGMREGRGDFFAFIDDDDIWLPEKLEKQMRLYEELKKKGHDPGFIYTGLLNIDADGKIRSRVIHRAAGNVYPLLIFTDFVGTPSSVLIPRKVQERTGFFDTEMVGYQDGDMWMRIAKDHEIFSLNEFLTQYRRHDDSLSRAKAPLMMRDQELILQKILKENGEEGLMDKATQNKLIRYHHWEMAETWKAEGCRRLFTHRDAGTFRQFIREVRKVFPSSIGPKVWAYYFLSYLSPRLCAALHRLKKRPAGDPDIDMDVSEFDFNR